MFYRVEYVSARIGLPDTTATEEADGAEFLVVDGAKIQALCKKVRSTRASSQGSSRMNQSRTAHHEWCAEGAALCVTIGATARLLST